MRIKLTVLTLIAAVLLVAACGSNPKQLEQQHAMDQWEALVRWSEFDALIDMIHPEWLAANPISQLDMDRLHQFRVTEYRVRQVLVEADGEALERRVRIRMYHQRTAQERTLDHREVWRYDSDLDRWLLHSGLPDPRQSR